MAEGVGFEPTRTFALPVFKTAAINRSTTPPVPYRAFHFATVLTMGKVDRPLRWAILGNAPSAPK